MERPPRVSADFNRTTCSTMDVLCKEIQELLYNNTRYARTMKKKKDKTKHINKSIGYYDDFYKYAPLSDQLEHRKGEKHTLQFPLKVTRHAEQRRRERPCKPNEKRYDVVKDNAIVTSFPIPKETNTAMLKHLNHKTAVERALRGRAYS